VSDANEQRRPDYITTVWVDAGWKAVYRGASDEERREMRRHGVTIHYRHQRATDELIREARSSAPVSTEEFLGA